MRELFPTGGLGKADYILGASILAICFVFFFHDDIRYIGWDSLNYLFGNPLDFYENCKKAHGTIQGTSYPPTLYLIAALWLYPFKLFGWITSPASFSPYWVYWLKILTIAVYLGTGAVFYRICLTYVSDRDWAKYATTAWLTMPLAVFSQFIFCQCDAFYVLLTMAGFLMFLRGNLTSASIYFGVAVTFKYFPAFVFVPLLLLNEKRPCRIAICCIIFAIPTLLIHIAYRDSPAFIEGIDHFEVLNRIYAVSINTEVSGFLKLYGLPASFAILCGLAFFTKSTEENRTRTHACFWLISAILPFVFILWHPQWVMFFVPPLVLTTMIHPARDKLVLVDLVGMFLYVAAVSLIFTDNVDAAMFQGQRLGLDFYNSYWMADLFGWFGDRSRSVFYSGFSAYLILQVVIKIRALFKDAPFDGPNHIDYGDIRRYFYAGLALFLAPVSFVIARDLGQHMTSIANPDAEVKYGGLVGTRRFEQTFIANGRAIRQIRVPLEPSSLWWGGSSGTISMEIFDSSGKRVAQAVEPNLGSHEFTFHKFLFDSVPVLKGAQYRIRLTSPTGPGVSWFASEADSYKDGQALVDGIPQKWDFSFQIDLIN